MRGISFVGAMLAAVLLPSVALAWPGTYEGLPQKLRPAPERGAYLWREADGMHRLLGVGRDPEPWTLEARVTTDGVFHDVDAGALEPGDSVEQEGERTLKAKFTLFTRADGVRFRVRDAEWIEYELWENGAPMPIERINVGTESRRPLDSRIRIYNR